MDDQRELVHSAAQIFVGRDSAARFRLFAAVAALLKSAAAVQPLLLILDDLHAADPALLLLRFVARDLRGNPLLVIVTYRDSDAERRADVSEALGELVREGPGIRLRGLGRVEVRQFVESLMGTAASEDDLSRISEATGGNPLFIRELVRLTGTGGAPGRRGHRAGLPPAGSGGFTHHTRGRDGGPEDRHTPVCRTQTRGLGGAAADPDSGLMHEDPDRDSYHRTTYWHRNRGQQGAAAL
jgi:hypothetical protein